jgi:hypothetical protein
VVKPVYTAFYTPDYAHVVKRLIASLNAHGLKHDIQKMEDTGRWVTNCAKKARFVWEMMDKYPKSKIIWVDADAVVHGRPVLIEQALEDWDFAVTKYSWTKLDRYEILSGTVGVAPTVGARKVVDRWIEECEMNTSRWDQKSLRAAVERSTDARIFFMPISYCFISDTHRWEFPHVEPVIEHFQESRRTRRLKP